MAKNIDLGQWLNRMYSDYTAGQGRKEAAFQKGVGALQSYADIFQPGGEYGAGVEAMIGRGEKKAVASGMQNLVSAGLANTTIPMHLQQTYEEEVGMPTRLRAEDTRMERLGGALGSLGQMYAGYDPGAATAGDIAHMATGGFGAQTSRDTAEMQAQLELWRMRSANQARSSSQQLFGGGGGGAGGSPSGGGVPNPYGGGGGGGGGGTSTGGTAGVWDINPLTGRPVGGSTGYGYKPAEMLGLYGAENLQGGLGTYEQQAPKYENWWQDPEEFKRRWAEIHAGGDEAAISTRAY